MSKNTVLIIGGGAREHAISCAYEKSASVEKIIVAPGNDFIPFKRKKEVAIDKNCDLNNPESILKLAEIYKPLVVDVAQDNAIASGAVDLLVKSGFLAFGPTKEASRIEWDKKWAREFMKTNNISCPGFQYFDSEKKATEYVKKLYDKHANPIIYVKATGLCSGKGALKSSGIDEAIENVKKMKSFGQAGKTFLVEEGLSGEEFSYYAITDGLCYKIFKSAQDNKTVFNFDCGDQTGGMGAVSPAMVTFPISGKIEQNLISKAIMGLRNKGLDYKGIIYLGGIVADGKPKNIEYNARWGDPECQAVLPSVKTDYLDLVLACINGKLDEIKIKQDNKIRVCVVGASRGYPGDYSGAFGKRIRGLEEAMEMKGISIFGAGIKKIEGNFHAHGGRLFSVVAEGKDIIEARQMAYSAIARINIEGNNIHYRTDIGWRDVERFLKE